MTIRLTPDWASGSDRLDEVGALRRTWRWYVAFLLLPIILFISQGLLIGADWPVLLTPAQSRVAFIGTLIWIGITGPLGFLGQSHFFRHFYRGNLVSGIDYLHGKLFVWFMLCSGAFLASVFIVLSHSFLPHMMSIAVIYPFLLTQYPNGSAMTDHHGNSIRASLYSEPK